MITFEDFLTKVQHFEGFRSKCYICPAGYATIGFGHQLPHYDPLLKINHDQATKYLKDDLQSCIEFVKRHFPSLCANRVYALADICFNCGKRRFLDSNLFYIIKMYSDLVPIPDLSDTKDSLNRQICNNILSWCHYRDPKTKEYKISSQLKERCEMRLHLWNNDKLY